MTFDNSISLGNVLTIVSFLGAFIMAWRDLNWRVTNIENWKAAHEHTTEEAIRNICLLRESVVKMSTIAEGQEKRICIMEDRANFGARTH